AMAKPTRVVKSVWLAFSQIAGQNSTSAATAALGGGKTKTGTLKMRHASSQSRKNNAAVNHGLASNRSFRILMSLLLPRLYASECHGRNEESQARNGYPTRAVVADRSSSCKRCGRDGST